MLKAKVYGSSKSMVNLGRKMGHSLNAPVKRLGHTNSGVKRLGHTNGSSMGGKGNLNTELYPRF